MKKFIEFSKAFIAFAFMTGSGVLPELSLLYWVIRESVKQPDLTPLFIIAGVIASPAAIMIGLVASSLVGGFFIKHWGPK